MDKLAENLQTLWLGKPISKISGGKEKQKEREKMM